MREDTIQIKFRIVEIQGDLYFEKTALVSQIRKIAIACREDNKQGSAAIAHLADTLEKAKMS